MHRIKKKRIKPGAMIMGGFLALIVFGALLLMLPISSRAGEWSTPILAFFTSTSATCVTGMVMVDTYQYWSGFGQVVILFLLQIGGLGFMTVAALISLVAKRSITLRERMVMTASLNVVDLAGVVRLTKHILLGTLFFESIGAVLLSYRFIGEYGVAQGIWKGIFHSVSAFCNAGFDLMGVNGEFSSFTTYANDSLVMITLMMLIVIGGLGFFIWGDIVQNRKKSLQELSLHTKVVLSATVILLLGGAFMFFFYEHANPETLGNMTLSQKWLNAMFQSVTTRTAGFNTFSQQALSESSRALSSIFMFIGGGPGSTAGGVKIATMAILVIGAFATLRGKKYPQVFHRSIGMRTTMNAITVTMMGMTILLVGVFLIGYFEPIAFSEAFFEATSSFGTVGLSLGFTPTFSTASHLTMMALMWLGRVGILTLGFTVFNHYMVEPAVKYPESRVLLG